jgi:predicted RNA binding protein YcfA (HicA-like mRNA interferase family)
MKARELINLIEDDGWFFVRQRGSHLIYKHPSKSGIVVVSHHGLNKDMPNGTENSILKQAGLK